MSRVLVTGGCGFVGSWVTRELVRRGHDVRVASKSPSRSNLDFVEPGLSGRVELLELDIADREQVLAAARDCEHGIHLAGIMTVDCRGDPVRAAEINVIGSLNFFEAALAAGMRQVAYISSAGIFGTESGVYPRPMTHYGAHKLAVEGFARAYFVDHGLPSVGFRPYIIYGPGESSGISSGPSRACRAAHEGRAGVVGFSGPAGFVHVGDVARAFALAIATPLQDASAFTMVGESRTVADFVAELKRQMPASETTIDGEPMKIAADLADGEWPQWLAGEPVTGIGEGIARTLAHYRGLQAAQEQGA